MNDTILQRVVIEDFSPMRLFRSVIDGLTSRAKSTVSRPAVSSAEAVRLFYEIARGNEPDHDIIDMSQGTYRGFLDLLPEDVSTYLNPRARVLDLGCGNLSFLHHLNNRSVPPLDYYGVDILPPSDTAAKILRPRWVFQQGDMGLIKLECPFAPNLVLACNSFCYLEDPNPLIRQAANALTDGGSFVLIEPVPSLFWETYFSGVHLHLRKRGAHNAIMAERRLVHRGDYVLYALRFGDRPVWPVAYLSIFSKMGR